MRPHNLQGSLRRLEKAIQKLSTGKLQVLQAIHHDPTAILRLAGLAADAWQSDLLASRKRQMLVLCSRQAGKSTAAAALALRTALTKPMSPILLVSRSRRQSEELFRKVLDLFRQSGRPMGSTLENKLELELTNGSRILCLPGSEATIRGFSGVALMVIDEAARVPDELYYAVRPMLAVSRGRLIALSTPFGKRGWFYEAWRSDGVWERIETPATRCRRISKAFLEEERLALGQRWFAQEYLCSFEDAVGAVFLREDLDAAFDGDVLPLF